MKWFICMIEEARMPKLLSVTKGSDFIVPTYDEEKVHKRRARTTSKKLLYPYYIFVKDMNAFAYLKLNYGKKVHLLSHKQVLARINVINFHTIDEDELNKCIKKSMDRVMELETHTIGEKVKVLCGPFVGHIARIKSISANKVRISIELFKRLVSVDINKEDVEKI